jgi:WD40 repeat protein
MLLARHSGGGAQIWRLRDDTPIAPGPDGRLVAFVPGTHTVAIAFDKTLALHDLDTGRELAHATIDGPPYDLWVSDDGRTVAASRFDALWLWQPAPSGRSTGGRAGEGTDSLHRVVPGVEAVALITGSHDGATFVTCGHRERALWAFDVATATARKISSDERCSRQAFTFSPDDRVFLSAGLGGELRLHPLAEGKMRVLLGHQAVVADAVFSADGHWIASASADHTVRLWRRDEGDVRVLYDTVAFDRPSRSGQLLANNTRTKAVSVIDLTTGTSRPIEDPPAAVRESCLSGNGNVAALLGADRSIVLYDLVAHTRRTLPPNPSLVGGKAQGSSALSFDGGLLVQANERGRAIVLDLATGELREIAQLGDAGFSIVFSDDSRWVAVGSRDGTTHVIDVRTGAVYRRLAFRAVIWNQSFSPDGARLAVASNDGLIHVVDLATGHVHELRGHLGATSGADFLGGDRVLTSGVDGTLRLWSLATDTGEVVHREPTPITSVQVLTNGLAVIRSHDTHMFRIWDTRVLPPLEPAQLSPWLAHVTTATVDARGELNTP